MYVITEALAEEVTGFHVHRGALASLHREERYTVTDLLTRHRLVVMEDIVDHTNVGAILRNAAALGWDGALLSPRAADPLYRRAIKVSMGAVFSLPWARLTDWPGAPARLADAGFVTVALTLAPDAVDLALLAADLRADQRVAIMVGTEGAGLSPHWTAGATVRATIPMQAGIDSLNVAAASAIACYSLSVRGRDRPVVGIVVRPLLVQGPQLLAGPAREPVAEHDAVQMVGLVLQAAGQQAGAGHLHRSTTMVLTPADGAVGAGQLEIGAGQRQAALVGRLQLALLSLGQDHLGIAQHADLAHLALVRAVVDEDGEVDSYLGGGQPDPLGGVHGGEHVRTSSCSASSKVVTGRVRACITGSPQRVIDRIGPPVRNSSMVKACMSSWISRRASEQ